MEKKQTDEQVANQTESTSEKNKTGFISLDKFHKELPEDAMVARSKEFYNLMKRRRTVRHFSPRPVPKNIIENAIKTAGTAPNGANLQPWHFAVAESEEVKKRIREAAEEEEREFYANRAPDEWLDKLAPLGTDEHKPFLEIAPYLIAVFTQSYGLDSGGNKIKHYYVKESVGIACGMLITALHNAGLVTLTHTPSPMGFLNDIMDRPSNERPYLLVVTGYPAEDAIVPDITKKSLSEFSSFH
jgi:nitroreductase